MVTVDVDLTQLSDFSDEMPKIQEKGMNLTALDLLNRLKRKSPVDHGLLRQWFIASKSKDKVIIKSPAKYTVYQNYGTDTHMIKPKNKKALFWGQYNGKKPIMSKGHTVKGIKGKHFVENSIAEVQPRIQDHFKVAIREVLG